MDSAPEVMIAGQPPSRPGPLDNNSRASVQPNVQQYKDLTEELIKGVTDVGTLRALTLRHFREASVSQNIIKEMVQKEEQSLQKTKLEVEQLQKEIQEWKRLLEEALAAKDAALEEQRQKIHGILEAELKCSICLEIYIEPAVLGCGHTYCHHCISTFRTNGKSNCPKCRVISARRSIRSLEVNNLINRLHETFGQEVQDRRKETLEERTATVLEVTGVLAVPDVQPIPLRRPQRQQPQSTRRQSDSNPVRGTLPQNRQEPTSLNRGQVMGPQQGQALQPPEQQSQSTLNPIQGTLTHEQQQQSFADLIHVMGIQARQALSDYHQTNLARQRQQQSTLNPGQDSRPQQQERSPALDPVTATPSPNWPVETIWLPRIPNRGFAMWPQPVIGTPDPFRPEHEEERPSGDFPYISPDLPRSSLPAAQSSAEQIPNANELRETTAAACNSPPTSGDSSQSSLQNGGVTPTGQAQVPIRNSTPPPSAMPTSYVTPVRGIPQADLAAGGSSVPLRRTRWRRRINPLEWSQASRAGGSASREGARRSARISTTPNKAK